MNKSLSRLCELGIFLITCLLLISGCSPKEIDTLPLNSTNLQENSQSILEIDKIPNIVEKEYVVVQDYSDSEESKSILNVFAEVINEEIAVTVDEKDRTDYNKELFIINTAVPFYEGVLICGHILMNGEVYCNLYYFEDNTIKYRSIDSDVWSLNYTVFRDHTIAYGKPLGWDNGVIMHDKVVVYFADGQTVSCSFTNIPFMDNEKWRRGLVSIKVRKNHQLLRSI